MIEKALYYVDDVIATTALSLIILLTGVNVFSRYLFNNPFAWMTEISLGLFVWMVFIGISSTMKRDGHVGVDYLVNKMPKSLQIISNVVRSFAIYFVLIYVFMILGSDLMSQASRKSTSVLGISYQVIYLAIPLGGLITAAHFTRKLVGAFNKDQT